MGRLRSWGYLYPEQLLEVKWAHDEPADPHAEVHAAHHPVEREQGPVNNTQETMMTWKKHLPCYSGILLVQKMAIQPIRYFSLVISYNGHIIA